MNTTDVVNAELIKEIHDIRGPVSIPGDWLWLWIFLGVFAAGLAIVLLIRFIKEKQVKHLDPVKEPWQTALEAIAAIEQGDMVRSGRVKEYYSELSGVIRWYIEERFHLRAPEMTTEEFIHVLRYSDKLSSAQQGFLQDFLNASDMVKFAKQVPHPEEMFRVLRLARSFVEETR
jgi:hypothetical protein